jgi:P-type E1-E2 ATPase
LGQIKFVFTDKTGTLTKNNMVFKNLICGAQLYGEKAGFDKKEDEFSEMSQEEPLVEEGLRSSVKINDSRLRSEKVNHHLDEALRLISLCHDINV